MSEAPTADVSASAHVLLVDDDIELVELLRAYLVSDGFRVSVAHDGESGVRSALVELPDIAVIDVMMPGYSGIEVLRRIRARSSLPVLMLTARGEETDRIVGIEMGADDYLVKPFNPRELLARIKTILRRTRALPPNMRPDPARYLVFSGWSLDTGRRRLTSPAGVVTPLSGGEYRLLHILLEHPNRVLNRDQLTEMIHGREAEAYDRAIDVQVSRLRQRLQDESRTDELIKTVRGEGYVLASTVEGRNSCD